jgi:hypothetical protein
LDAQIIRFGMLGKCQGIASGERLAPDGPLEEEAVWRQGTSSAKGACPAGSDSER